MAVISCTWNTLKSNGDIPSARTGHAIAVLSERIFLFGGSRREDDESQLQCFNDLYEARVENDIIKWQKQTYSGKTPQTRWGHSMCAFESFLYVFGGTNEFQRDGCIRGVARYNIDGNLWGDVETRGPSPCANNFSVGLVKKRAFVFGGVYEHRFVQDMFLFNFDTNQWTPIQCRGFGPTPRCDHKCEVVGDVMFVFGGTEGPGQYCNDLYSFDTNLFSWTNVKYKGLPPAGRASHSFVAHRDKDIYVFGGYGTFTDNTCTNIVHKFSLGNQKWKQPLCAGSGPPMKNLYGHCGFILHSNLFLLGGVGDTKLTGFNQIYSLRFINPSFRKPVIEHVLNDFCKQSNSLACWLPTQQPPVSYTVGKSDKEVKKQLETFTKASLSDTLPLSTQLIGSESGETEMIEAQRSLFRAAREELAQAKQVFENDKKQLIGLLERQRNEVQTIVDGHKRQNELWWKARLKENDDEREKLRVSWKDLDEERISLERQRVSLKQKANQITGILRQLSIT